MPSNFTYLIKIKKMDKVEKWTKKTCENIKVRPHQNRAKPPQFHDFSPIFTGKKKLRKIRENATVHQQNRTKPPQFHDFLPIF